MRTELVKLGDICEFQNGRGFKKSEWRTKGLPIIRIQNLNNVDASYNYFDGAYDPRIEVNEGDLLFSWSGTVGSSFGPHLWTRERGVLNQHIFKVALREDVDKSYAYYALKEITTEIEKSVSGAVGLVHVTKRSLCEFEIPLPPLSEQRRLVGLLDAAFAGLATATAHTQKNLTHARELFETALGSTFIKDAVGWRKTQLQEVCLQITDGKHGDCENKEDSGFYFLSAKDVKGGTLQYEKARQITELDFKDTHRRTKLEPGDILITNSGTIGRMAIAPDHERTYKTTFQKSVAILKIDRDLIDVRFAYYSLSSSLKHFMDISSGTAQKNLLLRDLRSFTFYIPPSLEDQREVATHLDRISGQSLALKLRCERKLAALEELKQSLLHRAFRGELSGGCSGGEAVEQLSEANA